MPEARRKFVLLLVEGPSDASALRRPLEKLFKSIDSTIVLHPLFPTNNRSNDLTAEHMSSPDKLVGVINSALIRDFLDHNSLEPKDIVRVIQIADLDGAFIPNASIRKQEEGKIIYDDYVIYTRDVEAIRERNSNKRTNLNYLSKLKRFKIYSGKNHKGSKDREKNYAIFYFSCNLDHFLHGSANLPPENKVPMARAFGDKCQEDLEHFIDVFTKSDEDTCDLTYDESWDFIKEDLNSLKPHSNLGVLVNELTGNKSKSTKKRSKK